MKRWLVAVSCVTAFAGLTGRADLDAARLFKDCRAHLAAAIANDEPFVTLILAVRPGAIDTVAWYVTAAGGEVVVRVPDIGYLRVRVPTAAAIGIAALSDVDAAGVSITGRNYLPSDRMADAPPIETVSHTASAHDARPAPPAGDEWLRTHRYRPHGDLGLDALRARHPAFDGRGTTVAVLDGFVDPLLTDFAHARDLQGRETPKLIDQINATDPRDGDPQWIEMRRQLDVATSRPTSGSASRPTSSPTSLPASGSASRPASGPASRLARGGDAAEADAQAGAQVDVEVDVDGRILHLPRTGAFHLGTLDERRFDDNFYLRGDLNRDGNPAAASREFHVLWDRASGEVWVDTDQDHDFRDESPLREYRLHRDIGTLGRDRPDTPVRDSIGFTITLAPEHDALSLNLGTAAHGTEVAGALVASRSADGLIEGVAANASLINVWHGSTSHGLVEGAIRAFSDPRVDVVIIEQNVFLTMDYALDDGGSAIAMLLDRLSARYAKLAFAPASNIPGPLQLNDVSLGSRILTIGAYESAASWWTFDAARVARRDNIGSSGSFGPGGAGGMKPDVVAPLHAIAPYPAYLAGGGSRDLYTLPPGRAVCGGTSCATPIAAGVALSLLSGARQTGLEVTASRLRQSLVASARFLDRDAHGQGAGLLQALEAWQLLASSPASSRAVPAIQVTAAVRTALADLLATPFRGHGTWLREPGATDRITITFRRTDGPVGDMRAALRWHTPASAAASGGPLFEGPTEVALPLGVDVPVEFRTHASTPGIHSAALAIEDPETRTAWHVSLHTVVIAEEPDAAASRTITHRARLRRPGLLTVPIRVAPGTGALSLHAEADAPVRIYAVPPDRKLEAYFQPAARTVRHVVANPSPGVWFVTIAQTSELRDRLRTSPLDDARVTLTAGVHRVEVIEGVDPKGGSHQDQQTRDKAREGDDITRSIKNVGAQGMLATRTTPLARRITIERRLASTSPATIDLDVPAGADWLSIDVRPADRRDSGSPGSGAAAAGIDLDAHLFQCASDASIGSNGAGNGGGITAARADAPCRQMRGAFSRRARERLFVPHPTSGRWRLVIDAFMTPGDDPVDITVIADIADRGLGVVAGLDPAARRDTGGIWTVSPRIQASTSASSAASVSAASASAPAPVSNAGREDGANGVVVIARLPIVAADLETPLWAAPSAPRGEPLQQMLSWFPLEWLDVPAAVPGRGDRNVGMR